MLQANPVGSREGEEKRRKYSVQEAAQRLRQQAAAPLAQEGYKGIVDVAPSGMTESDPLASPVAESLIQETAQRVQEKEARAAARPSPFERVVGLLGPVGTLVGATGIFDAFKGAFDDFNKKSS